MGAGRKSLLHKDYITVHFYLDGATVSSGPAFRTMVARTIAGLKELPKPCRPFSANSLQPSS